MPEEVNRVLTDHVADYLFASTDAGVKNLQREGIPDARIYLVGDVMYDASLYYGEKGNAKAGSLVGWAELQRIPSCDDPQG